MTTVLNAVLWKETRTMRTSESYSIQWIIPLEVNEWHNHKRNFLCIIGNMIHISVTFVDTSFLLNMHYLFSCISEHAPTTITCEICIMLVPPNHHHHHHHHRHQKKCSTTTIKSSFTLTFKETQKLQITGHFWGWSTDDDRIPSQMASNTESVSMPHTE